MSTIPRRPPSHKASIAADFTFQTKNWHPIGRSDLQIHARGCWLFLEAIRASMTQRHPGRIGSHARIKNVSIHLHLQRIGDDLQLQQTGDKNGGPPGRYSPTRCRNPNLGFVDPVSPSGRIRSHSLIAHPSLHVHLQQTGVENGGPPGRYRPPRGGNPNLGFVQPAPPGEDKIP